jgi:hypothetical protein
MIMKESMKKAALAYLDLGFNVMPLRPDNKKPYEEWLRLQKDRVEPYEVDSWWLNYPNANVGIITGEISNLVVFDLDSHLAEDHVTQHGTPRTPMARTSKGLHIYFSYPSVLVGNKSDKKIGMDVRGEGGYVVAPPSVHESGFVYRWSDLHPWNTDIKGMYPWMLEFALAGSSAEPKERGWQCQLLYGVGQGGRNQAAASLAGRFLNKDLSEGEIVEILLMWNQRNSPPLPESEVERTVMSMAARHNRRD